MKKPMVRFRPVTGGALKEGHLKIFSSVLPRVKLSGIGAGFPENKACGSKGVFNSHSYNVSCKEVFLGV